MQLHVKKLFTYTYNVTYTYILTYIIRRHSSLVPIVLLVARMDSSDVGYWMHSWPIEVQRIEDTVAEWFGPGVGGGTAIPRGRVCQRGDHQQHD